MDEASGSRPVIAIVDNLDDYNVQVLSGIARNLLPRGIPLLVTVVNSPAQQPLPHIVLDLLRPGYARGVVVFAVGGPADRTDLPALLAANGAPVVTLAGRIGRFPCIHGDNESGMRALMAHLLDECGVRRPLLVRGIPGFVDSEVRERVVREECLGRGLRIDEDLVLDGWFRPKPTMDQLNGLLARRRDFDAVIALNDISAFGVLSALPRHGLGIPDDVLVTGFDNVRDSAASWPPLTTIDQHMEEQGALAVDLLMRQETGQTCPDDVAVPPSLVVRASTVRNTLDLEEVTSTARALQARLTLQDLAVEIGWTLAECRSVDDIVASLEPCLKQLGISRCFLGLERPEPDGPPDHGRTSLAFSYLHGQVQDHTDEVFHRRELLPTSLRSELRREVLIVQPLWVSGRDRGHLIFDLSARSPVLAEALRMDVPRAVEMVFNSAEIEERATALERQVKQHTRELAQANSALHRTALLDGLTGIANRRAFDTHLGEACDGELPLCLLMVDVDQFKPYNDHYGHLAGDDALCAVATCLERCVEGTGHLPYRYGGEEFAVILSGCDIPDALEVADRLAQLLRAAEIPHETSPVAPYVTVSIGVAGVPRAGDTSPTDLIAAADGALYRAKHQGRDQIVVAEPARP